METRLSLTVVTDDESGNATVRVTISKWDQQEFYWNSRVYEESTIFQPLNPHQSTYPYAVAGLRTHTDRIVADLLDRIARGEVLLMHKVDETLRT